MDIEDASQVNHGHDSEEKSLGKAADEAGDDSIISPAPDQAQEEVPPIAKDASLDPAAQILALPGFAPLANHFESLSRKAHVFAVQNLSLEDRCRHAHLIFEGEREVDDKPATEHYHELLVTLGIVSSGSQFIDFSGHEDTNFAYLKTLATDAEHREGGTISHPSEHRAYCHWLEYHLPDVQHASTFRHSPVRHEHSRMDMYEGRSVLICD